MDIAVNDILIFAFLLFVSGIFSGSESALTGVSHLRVKTVANTGSRTAHMLDRLLEDRSRLISTLLIGNNIVNVALTVFATIVFTDAMPKDVDPALAATLCSVLTVCFLLVFGEVLPKTIGVNMPLRVSLLVTWPIALVQILLMPLSIGLSGLQRMTLKLVGHEADAETTITGADIKTMVKVADAQQTLRQGSSDAISNILDLHETRVREVMTPRTDVAALSKDSSYGQVLDAFKTSRFSRLPVYGKDIDEIVGVIYFKDMIGRERSDFSIEAMMRKAVFVPEQKRVDSMILEMRRTKNHVAIVVDEYGGTAGLVTLEDLLEEVVGQIEDEFDDEAQQIRIFRDGLAFVDAGCPLSDVEEALNVDFGASGSSDNIAGFFLKEFGKIPVEGDRMTFNESVEVIVNRMHGKRIRRFLVLVPTSGGAA